MKKLSKAIREAALKEALAIRQHATQKEIRNLAKSRLQTTQVDGCIYGQMTGNCSNIRAKELLSQCAPVCIDTDNSNEYSVSDIFDNPDKTDALIQESCSFEYRKGNYITVWSPIEVAIYENKKVAEQIIDIIKGKKDTL